MRIGRIIVVAVGLATTGCAYNAVGFVAANVTKTADAVVVDAYSVGAYLRTRPDNPGVSVGYSRHTYLFTRDELPDAAPGWHYWSIPLGATAHVIDSRVAGLDVRATQRETSVALGYAATTVMAQIPSNDSVILAVDYTPDRPELTRLVYQKEGENEKPCLDRGAARACLAMGLRTDPALRGRDDSAGP